MPIRRTYQFNTEQANRGDGIFIADPCDLHFRSALNYADSAYGIDRAYDNRLHLGQRLGIKVPDSSMSVEIEGGLHLYEKEIAINYTVLPDDNILIVDTTAGNVTLTLPTIANIGAGKVLTVYKKVRANNIIITPTGGNTLEGFTGTDFILNGNPSQSLQIISPFSGTAWRFLNYSSRVWYLNHEYGINPSVVINSSTFATVRSWTNVMLTAQDVTMIINGTGWYNDSTEPSNIEFAVFIDGGQGPLICWWNNIWSLNHLPFSGEVSFYNTTGLHTIELRARVKTGTHVFTMDTLDYLNVDLIQW